MVEKMSREDLMHYRDSNYMTVGDLKKFIERHKITDDAIVVAQRVEDIYYEKHHWKVYTKPGYHCGTMERFNEKLASGEFDDKEQYPLMTDKNKIPFTEEEIRSADEQYHPIWCPVRYYDEDEILFLDLHY